MRKLLLWPLRLLLYGFGAWLGLWVIFPAVGGGALGMLLAAPTAAVAIGLDIWCSAYLMGERAETVAVRRLLRIDHILGSSDRQIEKSDEIEALPDHDDASTRRRISPPSDR